MAAGKTTYVANAATFAISGFPLINAIPMLSESATLPTINNIQQKRQEKKKQQQEAKQKGNITFHTINNPPLCNSFQRNSN